MLSTAHISDENKVSPTKNRVTPSPVIQVNPYSGFSAIIRMILNVSDIYYPARRLTINTESPVSIAIQETQPSLTNRATRLEVSQDHQKWYYWIC